MAKRFIITILSIAALALQASPQGAIGSIKIHPAFGNSITKIIDTGNVVYYLSDNSLFSYDKGNDESDSYSRNNRLNGSSVRNIYYNYDAGYLAVAYDDSNIDILTEDGSTINMPDIYNAELQTDRGINDITFADGRMYVATEFGFVVFDDRKFQVEYSRNFGTNVYSVVPTDDYLWINADFLYYCDLANPPMTLDDMTATTLHESARLYPSDGNTVLFISGWFYRVTIKDDGGYSVGLLYQESAASFQPFQDGYLFLNGSRSTLRYTNSRGDTVSSYPLPEEMNGSQVASSEDEGQVWEICDKGLRHIQLDRSGGVTVLSDYYHPNASTVRYPCSLTYNDATGTLLVANSGQTNVNNANSHSYMTAAHISTLTDGWWSEALPQEIPLTNPASSNWLRDIYHPVFSPADPETYFIGSRFEGAYQIKGSNVVVKYDSSNSPIRPYTDDRNTTCVPTMQFDAAGNLWMLQAFSIVKLMVLPADKVHSASVTESDWITVDVPLSPKLDFFSSMYITKRNDIKIIIGGNNSQSIYFINDNGNPASASIQTVSYAPGQLYDQDGASYDWRFLICMAEDANGYIWLGTNDGVIQFNPANAFDSNFSVTLPRIPRNDGTNYADNLLDGITVNTIAVDGANRKWIGTANNGVYLVNADGSEVLQHYTSDNSTLPSNIIYSICCSTVSNSVYVGTEEGLVEIYSDASQPSADFGNVYAYPNPVRPEYTGNIAITGLMDNSLVKIADSAGNVVRSLRSVGGTAIWDGCNSSGRRVKTGVYFVLTSQSDGSNSSGTVATKILFVNQ